MTEPNDFSTEAGTGLTELVPIAGFDPGQSVLRFGCHVNLYRQVSFFCLTRRTPAGGAPLYELHRYDQGRGQAYECFDGQSRDEDGRAILVFEAYDSNLHVGLGDDQRMCIVDLGPSGSALWIDDLGLAGVTLTPHGHTITVGTPALSLPAGVVRNLEHAINLFVASKGSTVVFTELSRLADNVKQLTGVTGATVDVPLWVLNWLQRLLAGCTVSPRGYCIRTVHELDRLAVPMLHIRQLLLGYQFQAAEAVAQ